MRPLHLAIILGTGLFLQACAGTPPKQPSEESQIARSILDRKVLGEEMSCPARTTRYCQDSGFPADCTCVSSHSLRKVVSGSSY